MNINFVLLLILFIFIFFVFKRFNILKENINYSDHKKLGKANIAPILIGGAFIATSLLIFLPKKSIFYFIILYFQAFIVFF